MNSKNLEKLKDKLWIMWLMFFIFCILFTANNLISGDNATSYAWLLLELWIFTLDIIVLAIYKFPAKKYILISLLLAFLVMLTYLDVIFLTQNMSGLFSLITSSLLTFLSGMAAFRIFEKYPNNALAVLKENTPKSIFISIAVGLFCGILWGALNYFLMLGNSQSNLNINIHCFLTSLSPAILEELAMRTIFYAFCLLLTSGNITTKFQRFTYWVMMIVPHVLVHTPESFIGGGLINGLISTVLYIIIFGLIFAVLQKKRDITSAMIAHGTVDFIRFCFFGLPY